jgi:hypothetical protein
VVNSVAAAERKFNYTQLDDIAKSVSVSLTAVTNFPWAVLVFDKGTYDVGLGINANYNKSAVLTEAGNYKLSYAMIMKGRTCFEFDNKFANNQTQTY